MIEMTQLEAAFIGERKARTDAIRTRAAAEVDHANSLDAEAIRMILDAHGVEFAESMTIRVHSDPARIEVVEAPEVTTEPEASE